MTEFEKWREQTELPKSIYSRGILIWGGYEYLNPEDAEEIFDDIRNFLSGDSK